MARVCAEAEEMVDWEHLSDQLTETWRHATTWRLHLYFTSPFFFYTCILSDFSRCTPVFYAMREQARAQRARAMREQSCAVGNFAILRDFGVVFVFFS